MEVAEAYEKLRLCFHKTRFTKNVHVNPEIIHAILYGDEDAEYPHETKNYFVKDKDIMNKVSLEELLRTKVESPYYDKDGQKIWLIPDFRISVQGEKYDGLHIIIHPQNYDGETLDFIVSGDVLNENILDRCHESHDTEYVDSSHYEMKCKLCGATDTFLGGWGNLKYVCKGKE